MRLKSTGQYALQTFASPQLAFAVRRIHVDSEKLRWASVAGMMALAILLRVLDIDRVGFNSDEAVYSGQAAALVGNPDLSAFFSIFRAHPLLLQTLLGGLFAVVGVVDVAAPSLLIRSMKRDWWRRLPSIYDELEEDRSATTANSLEHSQGQAVIS